MVRTKADSVPGTYRKAVAATAPRKSLGSSSANSAASSSSQGNTPAKNKYAGGNPVCARPTPDWQKGIGDFFGGPPRKPDNHNKSVEEEEEEDNVEEKGRVVEEEKKKEKAPRKKQKQKENKKPAEEKMEVNDGEQAGGSGMPKAGRKSRPLPAEDEDD